MAEATRSKQRAEEEQKLGDRRDQFKKTVSPKHPKHVSEQAAKAQAKEAKEAKLQALREQTLMPPPDLPAQTLHQKGLTAGKTNSKSDSSAAASKGTPPKTVQFSVATPVRMDALEEPRLASPTPTQVPDLPFMGAAPSSFAHTAGAQDPVLAALAQLTSRF